MFDNKTEFYNAESTTVNSDNNDSVLNENEISSKGEGTAQPNSVLPEEELQTEIASLKDQLLRALAEVENIRRRSERERLEASQYAVTKFAREMLNVSDNLTRALDTVSEHNTSQEESLSKFVEGIRLTERELHNIFERHNIKKIMPQGEAFDHNLHQAIMEIPTSEHAPGTIIQVLQTGYIIQDRLLRPAMVSVAKSSE